METNLGRILLSELDSHPRSSPAFPVAVNWSDYATTTKPFPVQKSTFRAFISRDAFNFTELSASAGNLTVCQKDLCCHLSYRMLRKEENEVYALGAFSGLHGRRRREYWQVTSAPAKGSVWVSVNYRVPFRLRPKGLSSFSLRDSTLCQYYTHKCTYTLGVIIRYLQ